MKNYRKLATKIAPCRNCCPGGGAVLEATTIWYKREGETEYKPAWRCNNCGDLTDRRIISRKPKITDSQWRTFQRVNRSFGGQLKSLGFIGRDLFIVLQNKNRKWYDGQTVAGRIGVRGKMNLTLFLPFSGDVKIKNDISVKVYLEKDR